MNSLTGDFVFLFLAFPSRESDQAAKAGRLPDGHIGQHLPVDGDAGFLQPVDELAVGHSLCPAGGVDAEDPEPAHVAFALAAVEIGIAQRVYHRLGGPFDEPVFRAAMTAGQGQDFLMAMV